ncbi:hypothetical protein V1L52_13050 [Treponema sp. HNW]|uniref:hypothetical protein n=1 Tax=Treponema sp. HNW TaxID=3116654 RepID=UPI003D0F1B36
MMSRCIDKAAKRVVFVFFILPLISCVSAGRFESLDKSFAAGHYAEARYSLEADKNRLYTGSDEVLYYLDAGMLSRFAGDYEASNKELGEAEKLIEYCYAKSISQAVGSFILNDTLIDYAGEDYEDIYTNLFMALNYIQLGKAEDAFVEIRRFDNKIKLLSSKYEKAIYEAKRQTENIQPSAYSRPDLRFHNSALARYVSLLLYRSEGKFDSAEIDKKYIQSAFAAQPSLYPFPVPAAVEEEFSIPADCARLNVLCFTGSAPRKEEEVIRIPDAIGGAFFKIALPVMYKRPSKTASVEVEAESADGIKSRKKLELIESIENIAEDTFRQKQALLYTKAFLRAASKTTASSAVSAVLESQDDEGLNALGGLLRFASGIFIEVSERADTRISRFFPAEVRAGGLNLKSGLYTLRVTCYDKNGRMLYTETKKDVPVQSGKLNIVESVCTR